MSDLLIGLVGDYPGVGKDTSAFLLKDRYGFQVHSFAARLYEEVSAAYGVPVSELQRRDLKEKPQLRFAIANCRDEVFQKTVLLLLQEKYSAMSRIDGWRMPLSPRQILRWWGTEYRRKQISEDYWSAPVLATIQRQPNDRHVIVDTRLGNELLGVVRLGGVIGRILRPSVAPAELSDHPSEVLARLWPEDFSIDNDRTMDWLAEQWAARIRLLQNQRAA